MFRKFTDPFSRIFVGGLFIFSGLIKLNDPVGTKIKLEEYFEVFSQDFTSHFHYLIPWALEIGMFLVALEVVLGFAVLLYYRMNLTATVLLLLMIFFTFLTFYSAYFNKVTDCGCFGDAIKLTPWESFYKDVILMIFVLHLFWYRKTYQSVLRTMEGHAVIGSITAISLFLGVYAIRHLPFIDFRAYKIGNNIPQQMQPQESPVIEYIFDKNGTEIRSLKFLSETEGYTYVNSRVLNEDKTVPKITDFAVSTIEGEDITQKTFEGIKLLIVIYDVGHASISNMEEISSLIKSLDGKVEVMMLTSSSEQEFEAFRHEHQLAAPFYFCDATVLKTIVRSNPGITLWVNGMVKGMWHHNDTPDMSEIERNIS
ncbi:MAG: DoxX family protein, partial [Flammeovirgaceae bacterium]|nr:DoxX family protein [Flammeovirgaceae bacterium]